MKKAGSVLLATMLVYSGASGVLAEETKTSVSQAASNLQFGAVKEETLSNVEKAFINIAKEHKGIHKYGSLYVIAAGPKPNLGHGLTLQKQEQKLEQLYLHVKQTLPAPGEMYGEVVSYPYIAGKLDLPPYTTLSVLDADTGKPFMEEQNFTLDFKEIEKSKNTKKTWNINVDQKITKADLETYKISLKKLGKEEKEVPVTLSLSKNGKKIRVIPRERYEAGAQYLLQWEQTAKKDTKLTVLPFEIVKEK